MTLFTFVQDALLLIGPFATGLGFGYCVQLFHGTDVLSILRNPSTF